MKNDIDATKRRYNAIDKGGMYFLITGGDITKFTPESPVFLGYIFILLTPLLWANYSTVIKKLEKSHESQSDFKILKFITYFGCLELFIFVVISNQLYIFLTNFLNIVVLLCGVYLGLICFVFGYYTWNYSQKKLQSSKVASFLYIGPFITLIFSFIFQRTETIFLLNIVGAIIVLIGVVIINYKWYLKCPYSKILILNRERNFLSLNI